jgi:hypothetical protein
VCLERVKWKVDIARGFEALDLACARAGWGSALNVFAVRWAIFRGLSQPPEVDPFAAAIVAQDVPRLKELIGGRDVRKIEVDPANLPLDVPRPPWRKAANLLEIAAAVGGEVLGYLVEVLEWRPDRLHDCAMEQAIAGGDPEALKMVWEGRDAKARVLRNCPLVWSIDFHRCDVASWLTTEYPEWRGLARRVARERRVFDVLSRLPEGGEQLPEFCGLLKRHAKVLEQLDIPLGFSLPRFHRGSKPSTFDSWLGRAGRSLLLVEGDGGRTLGALVAIRWPEQGKPAQDVRCRSFLFIIDGGEATVFAAATPPVLFHDERKLSVGELTLDMTKHEYSVEAKSSCTGGRFPGLSGKATKWEIWEGGVGVGVLAAPGGASGCRGGRERDLPGHPLSTRFICM